MSQFVSNKKYNKVKYLVVFTVFTVLLAIVSCFLIKNYVFNGGVDQPSVSVDNDGLYLPSSSVEGNGMSLNVYKQPLLNSDGTSDTTQTSYVVTATVEPAGSGAYLLEWEVTNNDDGAVNLVVSEDTLSATVTCLTAFATQKKVVVKYSVDNSISAELTLDYLKRVQSVSVSNKTFTFQNYPSSYILNLNPTFGVGTVQPEVVIKSGTMALSSAFLTENDNFTYNGGWSYDATAKLDIVDGVVSNLYLNTDGSMAFLNHKSGDETQSRKTYFSKIIPAIIGYTGDHFVLEFLWEAVYNGEVVSSGSGRVTGRFDVSCYTTLTSLSLSHSSLLF